MQPTTRARTDDGGRTTAGGAGLREDRLPARAVLAATWASFVGMYAYVDILSFYLPGTVEDILDGVVWEFAITQTWAVGSLVLVSVPVVMIALSALLPARASRTTNLVVAALYVPITLGTAVGESWIGFYGLAVVLELLLLAVVVRTAWAWPRQS